MTDGILLNEMQSDFLLQRYSIIILDEVHERKINTDILIGLLSRVVNIRTKLAHEERQQYLKANSCQEVDQRHPFKYYPLRLVLMSATIKTEDFIQNRYLFPQKLNVLNVESRQYPVNIYFNKATPENYLEAAVRKCVKIHRKLPNGGILVFLTGEREIKQFCLMLESQLREKASDGSAAEDAEEGRGLKGGKRKDSGAFCTAEDFAAADSDAEEDAPGRGKEGPGEGGVQGAGERQVLAHDPSQTENLSKALIKKLKCVILPLFSKLPLKEQQKVFESYDAETRLIVAATNVAETSLTIPNIKYIVDTGKEKKKIISERLSITRHVIRWISKASSNQRQGRAGRTSPGYCYRLYSPAVYANQFEEFSEAEIQYMPLENVLLHLKLIGIRDTIWFPYPVRPTIERLQAALANLLKLQAIQPASADTVAEQQQPEVYQEREQELSHIEDTTRLTKLGRVLALLPLSPKYAKMLLQGRSNGIFGYALLLTSYLSVDELLNRRPFFVQSAEGPAQQPRDKEELRELEVEDEEEEEGSAQQRGERRRQRLEQKRILQSIKEQEKLKQAVAQNIENRRKEVAALKSYFSKYFLPGSDLFIGINILGEFLKEMMSHAPELASGKEIDGKIFEYAQQNNLLGNNLKEIYYTILQLLEIFDCILENADEKHALQKFFAEYVQPDARQQKLLKEIIVAGFIDQVARKVKFYDETGKLKVAYEVLGCEDRAYIHQQSFMRQLQPDYIVYIDIIDLTKYALSSRFAVALCPRVPLPHSVVALRCRTRLPPPTRLGST